jgi:PAS domain-containing protein
MAPEKGGVMDGLLTDSMRRLRHIVDESTQDRPSVNSISDLSLVTAILDALPDYIWICDAAVRETVYISSACEKLLGVGRHELLGDCRRLLRRVHESDRHRVLQARQRAMEGEYEQLYRIAVRPAETSLKSPRNPSERVGPPLSSPTAHSFTIDLHKASPTPSAKLGPSQFYSSTSTTSNV